MFSLLVRRPDLLVDHVSGYAALVHEEASEAGGELVQRAVAWALAWLCAAVFLILAGVALMLGLLLQQFHWILIVAPGVVLLLGGVAAAKARAPLNTLRFAELRAQVDRDAQALRQAA